MKTDIETALARPVQQKQTFTFKGKTRLNKAKFCQKAIGHRITVQDAQYKHFCTSLSVFIPKLEPKHVQACTIFHMVNGNSSCFFRVKDSKTLVSALQDLINRLQSDEWLDKEWRIHDQSQKIINNEEWMLIEDLMDMNAWNEELEGTVEIQIGDVKKEEGGEEKNG